MAKPIEEDAYRKYLRILGWHLKKGGVDYTLYDQDEHLLCAVKINHGKGKKREVSPSSVRKTEKLCEERGFVWPPKKK